MKLGYPRKIGSSTTPGGHHRITRSKTDAAYPAGRTKSTRKGKPVGLDSISGRNKLPGTITELRYEGLLVQVTIDVCGYGITSIITSDAARALGLKDGVSVYALIKATEVMVIRG